MTPDFLLWVFRWRVLEGLVRIVQLASVTVAFSSMYSFEVP